MRGAVTIWKKESWTYLTSARWYVVAALIVFAASVWFFFANLQEGRQATLQHLFGLLSFILMSVTPIFTMRLVAEEANRGTLEMLLTSPIREWEIVVGKFFGALTAYAAIFVVTLLYPAILLRFADPDIGPMVAQYLGILLLSSAFIGVGIFASSVTDSQVLAAVFGYILLFGFWIVSWIAEALPGSAGDIGKALSLLSHLEKFNRGIIDSVDVFYYVAFTSIFLILSLRFVEARRWAA